MRVKQNRHSKSFPLALMIEDLRLVSQMTSHISQMTAHLWGFSSFYKFYFEDLKDYSKAGIRCSQQEENFL